ncbi:hypothetical protein HM1_0047 [Heliomicrobium modesticaldum Ice1]|uniref:Uncharacterized protein n=1 Tax=Heliobacterium modesticaldum (strain ATCC 51547 / Ice1) TaxID=498761 RepID=B0THZ9_HELMI|nr:hypothetical protein [Heliomicrobium modesticaldum]ABZ82672.1 hypothetical protein HM1_0047 [Heliomicrobium modesticaldum Ice1]
MKNNIITMAAVSLITAVIALSGVLIGTNLAGRDSMPDTGARNSTAATVETTPVEIPKTIAIPGYAQLVMKAGDIVQNVELHNPAGNPCYFVISIILPDGTEVYRSGLIEPGQKTDAIRLSQPLKAGTYKGAVLRYSCYSTKDKAPMNGADTKFTLEVV